jgi:hypothetical protein
MKLAAMLAAFTLSVSPAWAADGPEKLTDSELDQVTAGEGALLDVFVPISVSLQDIDVTVQIANVPVNLGAAVQVNAIGQAIQNAQVLSYQQVQQLSQVAP